jgi:hypothetical protein
MRARDCRMITALSNLGEACPVNTGAAGRGTAAEGATVVVSDATLTLPTGVAGRAVRGTLDEGTQEKQKLWEKTKVGSHPCD